MTDNEQAEPADMNDTFNAQLEELLDVADVRVNVTGPVPDRKPYLFEGWADGAR